MKQEKEMSSSEKQHVLKRKCYSVRPICLGPDSTQPPKSTGCSISNPNMVIHSCMKSFSSSEKKPLNVPVLKKIKLEPQIPFQKHFGAHSVTISKDLLKGIIALGQVWRKVIIAIDIVSLTIVAIDQHAIHERIRYEYYESFLRSLLYPEKNQERYLKFDQKIIKLKSVENTLMKKIKLPLHQQKVICIATSLKGRLDYLRNYFVDYNIIYMKNDKLQINIKSIPSILGEQIEVDWIFDEILKGCSKLPSKIDELLMSKACKNAIKFNDEIDIETLERLVSQLLHCEHPLYCVHGRNSIYPLCNFKKLLNLLELKRPRRKFQVKNICKRE